MKLLTLCHLFNRFMGFLLDSRHRGAQSAGSSASRLVWGEGQGVWLQDRSGEVKKEGRLMLGPVQSVGP